LKLDALTIDRDQFLQQMRERQISCSVHWRPLHLHTYYEQAHGWTPEDLPVASAEWMRLVSLPLFSAMLPAEVDAVVDAVRDVCARTARRRLVTAS
jgi:perosamine synthetase